MARKKREEMPDDLWQDYIAERRRKRMEEIDRLPPEVRELVYRYGYTVVRAFLDNKIRDPRNIKHLVETVLDEFSPTRGTKSSQGTRSSQGVRAPSI